MKFRSFSLLWVLLTSVLLLISCENFTQGVHFKEQLEYEIWLSKQTPFVVEGYSPQNTGTVVFKNSSIIINFNNAIDTETAAQFITIGVDEEDDSYKENYNTPVFENDNKTIKYTANEYNLINENNLPSFTICVNVHQGIKDINNVPLKEDKIFHFSVNDEVDNTSPVFKSVKFSLSEEKMKYIQEDNFIEGEITDENMDDIFQTNIANEVVYIYVEGHDYGGGKVNATLTSQQIYDAEGYSVNIAEDKYKFELKHQIEESKNYYSFVPLSLAKTEEKPYSDGLYKITIQLEDEAGNSSETPKIFYVIRDTILQLSSNAYLSSPLPDLRSGAANDRDITRSANGIESSIHAFAKGNFTSDVYFKYRVNGTVRKYNTDWKLFPTKISYGTSYGNFEVKEEDIVQNENGEDIFGEAFLEYLEAHKNQNVYVREYLYDAADNSTYKDVCIPGKPEVMYWDYDSSTGRAKIHIIDKSNLDISSVLGMNNVNATVTYKVYYAKKDSATPIEDTVLTRNSAFTLADEFDDLSDSFEVKIDSSSEYIIGVQTQYKFFSPMYTWMGTQYSSITIIDNVSAKNSFTQYISTPEFSYTKKNNGVNSGTFTFNIDYKNKQTGVNYYPAWSTDGVTYTFYEADSASIVVPTPVKPPKEWAADTDVAAYTNKAYLKVVALKGSTTVSSEVQEIDFTEDDDNVAPKLSTYTKNHAIGITSSNISGEWAFYDTMVTLGQLEENDFAAVSGGSIAQDDELHLKPEFTYYWEPYRESWGNNLEIYTAEQIANITNYGTGNLGIFYGNWEGNIIQYCSAEIPLEGFEDGDYMFFVKIEDTKGNYSYGTLGKTHIGSYKKEPAATYSAQDDLFNVKLDLQTGEDFGTTEIKLGYLNVPSVEPGEPEIGYRWEILGDTSYMTKEGTGFTYSHNTHNYSEWADWYPRSRFYRIQTLSYTEDSRYKGYSTADNSEFDYDIYDRFPNKTVSAPVYVYVNIDDSGNVMDTVCKNKYFTSSPNYAPMLLCDQPVLVQIIKCKTNLGNDIHEWEKRGTVIDVGMYNDELAKYVSDGQTVFSKDCTQYTQIDTSVVDTYEDSFFYVVTVHYADNTGDMSCVYYKN